MIDICVLLVKIVTLYVGILIIVIAPNGQCSMVNVQ